MEGYQRGGQEGRMAEKIQEIRLPRSPRSSESPKEVGPKEAHTKAHHNYITHDGREGENLKSSKRKRDSYLQRSSHKTIS